MEAGADRKRTRPEDVRSSHRGQPGAVGAGDAAGSSGKRPRDAAAASQAPPSLHYSLARAHDLVRAQLGVEGTAAAEARAESGSGSGSGRESEASESSSGDEVDDEVGHVNILPGELIAERYRVLSESGRGTFGKVLLCEDLVAAGSAGGAGGGRGGRGHSSDAGSARPRLVAIKVVRSIVKYTESAKIEADILEHVNHADPTGAVPVVQLLSHFQWQSHYCLVMEPLGQSLFDLVKANDYRPLALACVQSFADQLVQAVTFMHELRLIHTDLKLENILLCARDGFVLADKMTGAREALRDASGGGPDARLVAMPRGGLRVKVIDFGGATFDDESKGSLINTRQYRAPEVILGLGWGPASDVWSLGCILMELYVGELLFQTHDSYEHLALMEKILGPFPPRVVRRASAVSCNSAGGSRYFDARGRVRFHEHASRDSIRHVARQSVLVDLINPRDSVFFDLVMKMLRLDPSERITAYEALNHRLFTSVRGPIELPAPVTRPRLPSASALSPPPPPAPLPSRAAPGNGGRGEKDRVRGREEDSYEAIRPGSSRPQPLGSAAAEAYVNGDGRPNGVSAAINSTLSIDGAGSHASKYVAAAPADRGKGLLALALGIGGRGGGRAETGSSSLMRLVVSSNGEKADSSSGRASAASTVAMTRGSPSQSPSPLNSESSTRPPSTASASSASVPSSPAAAAPRRRDAAENSADPASAKTPATGLAALTLSKGKTSE